MPSRRYKAIGLLDWAANVLLGILAMGAIAVVVALVARNAGAFPEPAPRLPRGWQDTHAEVGKFRIAFPGLPVRRERSLPNLHGTIDDVLFEYTAEGRTFLVSYADFEGPELGKVPLKEIIATAREEILATFQGTPIREQDVVVSKRTGRELVMEVPGRGLVYARWFAVDRRLYALVLHGVDARPSERDALAFFGSFRILP